jgi:hypothetical protein
MKKFVAFGLGAMMATMTFTACSNDDALDLNEQEIQQNTVSSYISVRITGSNFSSTRAATYEDGVDDETENGISNNVQFFFFDKDGKFLTKGDVVTAPNFSDPDTSENIERSGQTVVEIGNFDSNNKPTMMVTLLNAPDMDAFEGGKTIADLRNHIYEDYKNGNKFIMTTASYFDTNNTKLDYTPLAESVFKTSGIYDASNAVDVYVERVAAKITLDMTKLNRFKGTDTPMYLGKFNVKGLEGTTKFYAKITGWGLNATAKKSYALKHLNENWLTDNGKLGFDWNDASRYRSYWGESWNYGRDGQGNKTYTTNFPDYYGDDDKDQYTLTYWKGNELTNTAFDGKGKYYCFENTNSADIINKNHVPATATCVLIKALLTDANGTAYDNIVKFHGGYYTREEAKKVIFEKALEGFDFQLKSGTKLTIDDVDWANAEHLNGHITLKLTEAAKNSPWYNSDDRTEDVTDKIDSLFEVYVNVENGHPCVSYKAGMYYYAPINHLNYTNNPGAAEAESNVYAEGYYGVVRNHVYQVVVNGFKQLQDDPTPDPSKPDNSENGGDDPTKDPTNPSGDGSDTDPDNEPDIDPGHGIEDDNEPIVPNPEDDQNWYLSTQINILSWRVVNQYVKI